MHLWFPGQVVPDHVGVLRSFPVLVMVAAYSRFVAAVMIPSRVTGDLLAGMWQLLAQCIGAIPRPCCGTTSPVSAIVAAWPRAWPGWACHTLTYASLIGAAAFTSWYPPNGVDAATGPTGASDSVPASVGSSRPQS